MGTNVSLPLISPFRNPVGDERECTFVSALFLISCCAGLVAVLLLRYISAPAWLLPSTCNHESTAFLFSILSYLLLFTPCLRSLLSATDTHIIGCFPNNGNTNNVVLSEHWMWANSMYSFIEERFQQCTYMKICEEME